MPALAVFLPFLGALIARFGHKRLGARAADILNVLCMCSSAVLAAVIFADIAIGGTVRSVPLADWIVIGRIESIWTLRLDTLSVVMMLSVTLVSALVHVYSLAYMEKDSGRSRFMAYLSLFTFAMLMLVTADDLLQLFFGWESVGLCSFLLIGFRFEKPRANKAAIKAFLMNSVGDFGLLLGIAGLAALFGSVRFDAIFEGLQAHAGDVHGIGVFTFSAHEALALLLFAGIIGKSAQVGLHTWLPDAMEGPTPVSALVHSATMVTVGVFLLARLSPLFEMAPFAQSVIVVIGLATAVMAALVAITRTDIKRVLAYSTMSQLGCMIFAAGLSAYGAAMFHLVINAFVGTLLFLGAGSVIHALSGERDMRKMGGLVRQIPRTYAVMWIGVFSLAGLPLFSGYYSRGTILEAACAGTEPLAMAAFCIGVGVSLLTALYAGRMMFLTFHGNCRADETTTARIHESPTMMLWPLYGLATGAVLAGGMLASRFAGAQCHAFWNKSLVVPDFEPLQASVCVSVLPQLATIAGIGLAWMLWMRCPDWPSRLVSRFGLFYRVMCAGFGFDALYERLFVRPVPIIGHQLWLLGDRLVIDRLGPDGLAFLARRIGRLAMRLQSGSVFHYALAMIAGLVGLMGWFLWQALGAGGGS
ncbi:MAG: NADH-quinone oxidoreductase subunit L [Pseudomonadota bacterium]|nr:NADH-quinone oxidoreductase subunit L [Pseudomonadota bacterium]